MRYLTPIRMKPSYFDELEREIQNIFFKAFYEPLNRIFRTYHQDEIMNETPDPIASAIITGQIYYKEDGFVGKFNSKTSKKLKELGAKFDSRSKKWKLARGKVSMQVNIAIAQADMMYKELAGDVLKSIEQANVRVDTLLRSQNSKLEATYEKTVNKINADITDTLKKVGIVPNYSIQDMKQLARSYTENLEFYIKKWTDKNILKLRKDVMANTLAGRRAESLVQLIMTNYGSSKEKAKFLARQETSLSMAAIRQQRYEKAGIKKYKWSTSHDERVRPQKGKGLNPFGNNHRILDGTVHEWSKPPIVDRETGRTANPGQDYNCRCVAIPILQGDIK